MNTTTSILSGSVANSRFGTFFKSYNVVKFMVNVRLMEKRVKSHAGKVTVTQ